LQNQKVLNVADMESFKLMNNQKDLVDIVVELQPLAVIKG
jgi:hypothetical protein